LEGQTNLTMATSLPDIQGVWQDKPHDYAQQRAFGIYTGRNKAQ
jgi:hypothetical protein